MEPVFARTRFSKPAYEKAARHMLETGGGGSPTRSACPSTTWARIARAARAGPRLLVDPQLRVPEESLYIRYEDTVVVTEKGVSNFTAFLPSELTRSRRWCAGRASCSRCPPSKRRASRRCGRGGADVRRAAALLLTTAAVGSAWADTYPRQPGIDVLHYTFRLTLADNSDAIEGEAAVGFRVLEGGVSEIALDLVHPSPTPAGRGMTVEAVTEAGAPQRVDHAQGRLRIHLARPGTRDELREFVVRYHGVPAAGLLVGPNKHGDRTLLLRQLAGQGAALAARHRPSYDKATWRWTSPRRRTTRWSRTACWSRRPTCRDGRRRTSGDSRCRSRRGSTCSAWRASRCSTWATFAGPADRDVGLRAGPRRRLPRLRRADAERSGFFRPGRALLVREARQRAVQRVSGGMEAASAIFYSDGA